MQPLHTSAIHQPFVVLVHGFLAHRIFLALLQWRLHKQGFRTLNWGYESVLQSIESHAERFAERLKLLDADPTIESIHLVAHSMGGIVARSALDRFRPKKLQRFVMLAPPNHGSFIAAILSPLIGSLLKPVAELSTSPGSRIHSIGMPESIEVGVIAAGWDQLVSIESTRLPIPHQHVIVPCMHSSLLFRRDVVALICEFLTRGTFVENRSESHDTRLSPSSTSTP